MTRAEIRREMRDKIKLQKTYTVTQEQLNQMVEAGVRRVAERTFADLLAKETDKAFVVMMCLPSVALHDVFGFGKERLTRFMNNVCDKYFCVLEDFEHRAKAGYDFQTFIDILKEETGFDVQEYLVERDIIQPNERK